MLSIFTAIALEQGKEFVRYSRFSDDVFEGLVVRRGGSVEIFLYIMQVSINEPTRW